MSRIRSKNTKPEVIVRKRLFSMGFRYRLHDKKFPGKPDIILPRYKTVIFVNGCFWHGHQGCRYFIIPKTRTEWWTSKISSTSLNDLKVTELIRLKGWQVLTIWECELKKNLIEKTMEELVSSIRENI
ncbi:very short patch repair endonuclease [Dyadobacter chenhuakuii]|uniref:Very short patch repair endonuclease n=1 Tax=Dyadobacter chenhuakuii TaxID=2909339 RepID=A0A9X1QG86_9BACT|nr:very short patch repair endonuclease [Dyadobacter chenhuakuii]MCF2501358.1 very short patch repair endonuclease [Dyadobacter chenhuakuii]